MPDSLHVAWQNVWHSEYLYAFVVIGIALLFLLPLQPLVPLPVF